MEAQHTPTARAPVAYRFRYWVGVALIVTFMPAAFAAEAVGGVAAFFAVGLGYGIATLLLHCPNCAWPLFRRGKVWWPWPSPICPNCLAAPTIVTRKGGV
jgi:hypothetical protein